MKKSIAFAVSAGLIGSCLVGASAFAAQVLTPRNGATDISTIGSPTGVALPAGTVLPIDMQYSIVNGVGQTQTANESGLGLKVQYDSTKFDPVVVYDINGVQTSTSISNLNTKCMIASPSDQLVSGNTREVVFGWIDTSIRAGGAVGWLGTADPAAPGTAGGCLNPGSPGIVTEQGAFDAVAAPVTLFRMGLRSKPTFNGGAGNVSTNVVITTAGNISFANTGNVDTNKTILINAAPAPTIALASVVSRKTHTGVGDFDLPLPNFGGTIGAAIDVEPRVIGTGHRIIFRFNATVSSTGAPTLAAGTGLLAVSGASAVASISGTDVTVTLTGVPDNQRIQVALPNVNGVLSVTANVGFLVGDVVSTGTNYQATGTDINAVKAAVGVSSPVSSTTFKLDVNTDGLLTGSDIIRVKSAAGLSTGPL